MEWHNISWRLLLIQSVSMCLSLLSKPPTLPSPKNCLISLVWNTPMKLVELKWLDLSENFMNGQRLSLLTLSKPTVDNYSWDSMYRKKIGSIISNNNVFVIWCPWPWRLGGRTMIKWDTVMRSCWPWKGLQFRVYISRYCHAWVTGELRKLASFCDHSGMEGGWG